MRCVARRVADGTVLSVIKAWLEMPVIERTARGAAPRRATGTEGRRRAG
jgi:RNA-directed DNA polymerase